MRQRFVAAVIAGLVWTSAAMGQACPEGHWEFVAPPSQDAPATFRVAGGKLWALDTKASPRLWRWSVTQGWEPILQLTSAASFAWGATPLGDEILFRGAFTAINGTPVPGAAWVNTMTGAFTPITNTTLLAGLENVQSDATRIYRSGSAPLPGMTSRHAWWDGSTWQEIVEPQWATDQPLDIALDGPYSSFGATQPGPDALYVFRYDFATNTWPQVGSQGYFIPRAQYNGTIISVKNYSQGCTFSGCFSSGALRFTLGSDNMTWGFGENGCSSMNGDVSATAQSGRYLYVWGSNTTYHACDDVVTGGRYIFDIETRRPVPQAPSWLPSGTLLGGFDEGVASLSAHGVALWRPGCGCDATASWDVRDSASLGQRRLPTIAWGPGNQFVSFGGRRPGGVDAGDTQVWNGSAWTAVAGSGPSARADTALASGLPQSQTGQAPIVLFGGKRANNTVIGDLWEFDGSTWSAVNAAGTPPTARGGHAMCAWGSNLVLFGGFTETGLADAVASVYLPHTDSWVTAPATGAPARYAHAMAYDMRRRVVVMFGGRDASGLLGDTWVFDYFQWVQHAGPGPSARDYHSMHWDAKLGGVRLIGGRDASGALHDQWLFTAHGWQRLEDVPGGPRWAHASAANFTGDQIIIGGIDETGTERADTLVTSFDPVIAQQPANVSVPAGQSIVLTVSSASEDALSYQWYRDQTPLADGVRVSGATTATLTIRSAVVADAGAYFVHVSNCAGTTVSDQATVNIAQCDSIDFNNNSVFPEDQDVIDFFTVLAGGNCATCNDIDFNNNTVYPEDQDVIDFFTVLAGGECT